MFNLSTSTNIKNFDKGEAYRVTAEEAIIACAKAGYTHLDCGLTGYSRPGKRVSPITQDNWEETVRNWKRMADEYGIVFSQAHAFFSLKRPITPDILPDGEFGEEMMRRNVLAAEILGVKWMVVHPVDVRVDGKSDENVNLAYNLDYWGKWNEFFKAHHVGMALENMIKSGDRTNCWGDINLLMTLVNKLDSDNVGTCLDTGHAFISGYKPEEVVRLMGGKLKALHIADNNGSTDEHIAPYMGKINWTEVVHALKEIDYPWDFAFEIHKFTGCFPKELQDELIRFTHTLGEHLLAL